MACTYTMEVKGVGNVEVYESRQCRGMKLSVRRGGIVRVSTFPATEPRLIWKFVTSNIDFIVKSREKILRNAPLMVFTPTTVFHTRQYRLEMSASSPDKDFHAYVRKAKNEDEYGKIIILYPEDVTPENEQLQLIVHRAIAYALKRESKEIMIPRLETLARQNGLKYTKVSLRDMKSRWGSCDTRGRICLNVQCMRLPDHLIDYVILHELSHTIYHDHQKGFWGLLDKLLNGKARQYDKELKNYHTSY
ncbi:MAG: DUF45 domain-containing protein [Marinilabiliaceae bacterium]|nr:DUF45 domain-containing protein [Marinilabiliaceae bacterium]